MRFRRMLVSFLLAMGLAIAPFAWARQNGAPIRRAGSAFSGGGVSGVRSPMGTTGVPKSDPTAEARVGARQNVAPTFRSASAELKSSATTAASGLAFCGGGVPTAEVPVGARQNVAPTFRSACAELKFSATTAASSDARPAGEAPKKPLNQIQVFALLAAQVPSHRVTMLVQERGIDFEPDDEYLREIHLAGGEEELVGALKNARVTKPEHVDPALQARQTEIRQHVARGAEFMRAKRYVDAIEPQFTWTQRTRTCTLAFVRRYSLLATGTRRGPNVARRCA
jgi:hypothetical protein